MDGNAFDLGAQLHMKKLTYVLSEEQRLNFNHPNINLDFSNWNSIKYLNNQATGISDEIDSIPNDVGGLYLFYLPCSIIPSISAFPFYIGRAQYTPSQNLRKRVREYFNHYNTNKERPKIYRMLRTWGKVIRLAYYPLQSNEDIIQIEADIINALLFPMNDKIPNKTVSEAIKAFG